MWPGFKASAFNYKAGLVLVMDNVNKFMSTRTCLEHIYDIFNKFPHDKAINMIRKEFINKTVIANWGNKREYEIMEILFD